MQLNILSILTALATVALANPAHITGETSAADISKRQVAGIYGCDKAWWQGNCWWQQASGGACHVWHVGDISSFGPDGGLTCQMYSDPNCGNARPHGGIKSPGLGLVGKFNDPLFNTWWVPKSFKCHWSS